MKSSELSRPRRSSPRDLSSNREDSWGETRHEEVLRGSDRRRDLLTFSVADEEYAVGIESIREIIKCRPVTEVPRVPPFVAGIVAVRGIVMPVIDLRLRLRLPVAALTQKARILVVTRPAEAREPEGREPHGLIVDRVHEVVRLWEQDIEPPTMLSGQEAEFIAGIGRLPHPDAPLRGPAVPGPAVPGISAAAGAQRRMLILLDLARVLTFDLLADALPGGAAGPVLGALAGTGRAASGGQRGADRERGR